MFIITNILILSQFLELEVYYCLMLVICILYSICLKITIEENNNALIHDELATKERKLDFLL